MMRWSQRLRSHLGPLVAISLGASILFCAAPGMALAAHWTSTSFRAGGLETPSGLAVDSVTGDVYVGNLGAEAAVYKFDPSHNLLSPPGSFPEETHTYSGVAVDPLNHDVDAVYAAPEQEVRIADPDTGELLTSFPIPGSANLFGLFTAVQIATDAAGNIYLPNAPNHQIQVFGAAGGGPSGVPAIIEGSGADALVGPTGVTVDGAGDIWVADPAANRIEEFESDGTFMGVVAAPRPETVAVDAAGDVFALLGSETEPRVAEFGPAGAQIDEFGAGLLAPSFAPDSIAIDEARKTVYVADGGNGVVRAFVQSPEVTTGAATEVGESSATVNGRVDPAGVGDVANCEFEYGTNGDYGQSVACSPSTPYSAAEVVSASLAGLEPSTTYNIRLSASNANGRARGAEVTFTTPGPPRVFGETAEPKTKRAVLSAEIDPYGAATVCSLEYVTEEDFQGSGYVDATSVPCGPAEIAAGSGRHSVAATLSNLQLATPYHYRFVASNSHGPRFGADQTFTTFGISSFSMETIDAEGNQDVAAGAHPYELVTQFSFPSVSLPGRIGVPGEATPKDIRVALPPGLIGDPTATPLCRPYDLFHASCSGSTQVGTIFLVTGRAEYEVGVYDLVPQDGVATQLGAHFNADANAYIDASIRTGTDYGIESASLNLAAPESVVAVKLTLWGVPAESSHDGSRACPRPGSLTEGGPCSSGAVLKPFLRNPTSCSGPLTATMSVDSWEEPGEFLTRQTQLQGIENCGRVPFKPTLELHPTATSTDSPSGLIADLHIPQSTDPEGLGTADLRDAKVTLPEGLSVDPSSANGLGACSSAQIDLHGPDPASCPDAAKIGTVEIETPLVEHPLPASIYLATPFDNPFDSLLAIYIAVDDPQTGVVVKLAGHVEADPQTGRLTTTFDQNPQLPFEDLKLEFFEGPKAPLRTPQTCGTYQVTSRLTPWSAPEGATATPSSSFSIGRAAGGGGCPTSASQLPHTPSFEAGMVAPTAGSYSPFVLHLARADGTQELGKIETTLPEGLLAKIAGVSECSNADIAKAESRSHPNEGAVEQASPSCPASSEVGTVKVGAGAGPQPYYASGHAYLAGPYEGAPLSLVVITPAVAGPFDLGSVVVRAALHVDPLSAQVTAVSDPIPHILAGIPLDVRSISLELNRSQFTVNPTNCGAKEIAGKATSLLGNVALIKSPFAAANCASLAFKPQLKLSFSGPTKRTGNPAIKAVLTQPKGANANIAGATVILPTGMLIDQAHINDPCTRVQFNSTAVPGEGCPAGSVLGSAKVWTPLLEAPEEGKVYFRSNGGERQLPDLVVALQGKIPVQLVGFIDSVGKKGAEVRRVRSRFQSVPDAPVSRFELKLAGGKRGLIENSENLCTAGDRATYLVTGQNGKTYDTEPKIGVSCPGKKKSPGKKQKGGRAKG